MVETTIKSVTFEGEWLGILDYAAFKKISISTIRRHIKAGRVKSKLENGKYFIFVAGHISSEKKSNDDNSYLLKFENSELKEKVRELNEKIAELKMLVDLYEKNEEKNQDNLLDGLPPLPTDV